MAGERDIAGDPGLTAEPGAAGHGQREDPTRTDAELVRGLEAARAHSGERPLRWLPADARIHIRARGAEAQLAVRRGEQRPLPSGPPHAVAADPPSGALEREEADAG